MVYVTTLASRVNILRGSGLQKTSISLSFNERVRFNVPLLCNADKKLCNRMWRRPWIDIWCVFIMAPPSATWTQTFQLCLWCQSGMYHFFIAKMSTMATYPTHWVGKTCSKTLSGHMPRFQQRLARRLWQDTRGETRDPGSDANQSLSWHQCRLDDKTEY